MFCHISDREGKVAKVRKVRKVVKVRKLILTWKEVEPLPQTLIF